jgi:hypothetical protein
MRISCFYLPESMVLDHGVGPTFLALGESEKEYGPLRRYYELYSTGASMTYVPSSNGVQFVRSSTACCVIGWGSNDIVASIA